MNRQVPQVFPVPPPTALLELALAVVEFETVPDPARSVFLKSQNLRFVLEQVVDGIEPFNAGLEVNDRVCSEVGKELGGKEKLLFVMYNVPREVSWMRDGTVPSRLLNDRSLLSVSTQVGGHRLITHI